ncbi:hypothetical protein BGZ95_009365 [Linnemannia exigua]|uniref:Uncharacterized protein n=1 Tax=Linnemannia exigua TaxID=604196 RepID=A0AAD4DKM7_9FUNG|nr:hypothetical protein BGZ95_009365 [Linnemannia exigua]
MSMPSSACQRFLNIPELIDILASQLHLADLSVLTRINRQTHKSCLPLLFKVLDLRHTRGSKVLLFTGALSLGRSTRHVRDLSLGPDELEFYYNCVYDFEVFSAQSGYTPAPRSAWFPPPDIRTRQLLALPPMTYLSRLRLEGCASPDNPYSMPSSFDTRVVLAQLCWLLSLNPHLSSLDVESITVENSRDRWMLVGAIAELHKIKELFLRIYCQAKETGDLEGLQAIAGYVVNERLEIQRLECYWVEHDESSHLPFKILEALPAQQVTELTIQGMYSDLGHPLAVPAILRHSTTLQSLDLEWSDGELPSDPGNLPYYDRPTPITLTEAEARHFEQLERLYLQIGRLTELRILCLIMVPFNGVDVVDMGIGDTPSALPGLMTLGDVYKGWPRYMNHLAGLTKLESISGSIDGDADGSKVTMGWREAVWMYEHWPRLSSACVFSSENNIGAPFQWLRRSTGRMERDQCSIQNASLHHSICTLISSAPAVYHHDGNSSLQSPASLPTLAKYRASAWAVLRPQAIHPSPVQFSDRSDKNLTVARILDPSREV